MTEYLCTSLGYSKQAYYKSLRSCNDKEERERYVLSIVEELRRDLPRLGVYKLWRMLNDNGLPVGRDWLFRLLHRHDLLVKMKKYRVVTTDSRAWRHQYPNLVKGYCVERANQVWVSDITYLVTGKGVVYLSLVTDAYSRRIMGWEVYPTLDSAGKSLVPRFGNRGSCFFQGLDPPLGPEWSILFGVIYRDIEITWDKSQCDPGRVSL